MITLDEAKAHLRVIHSSEDAIITKYIRMAHAIAAEYIGERGEPDDEVMDAVVLMIVLELFETRGASADLLSAGVKSLLERQRMPGFA